MKKKLILTLFAVFSYITAASLTQQNFNSTLAMESTEEKTNNSANLMNSKNETTGSASTLKNTTEKNDNSADLMNSKNETTGSASTLKNTTEKNDNSANLMNSKNETTGSASTLKNTTEKTDNSANLMNSKNETTGSASTLKNTTEKNDNSADLMNSKNETTGSASTLKNTTEKNDNLADLMNSKNETLKLSSEKLSEKFKNNFKINNSFESEKKDKHNNVIDELMKKIPPKVLNELSNELNELKEKLNNEEYSISEALNLPDLGEKITSKRFNSKKKRTEFFPKSSENIRIKLRLVVEAAKNAVLVAGNTISVNVNNSTLIEKIGICSNSIGTFINVLFDKDIQNSLVIFIEFLAFYEKLKQLGGTDLDNLDSTKLMFVRDAFKEHIDILKNFISSKAKAEFLPKKYKIPLEYIDVLNIFFEKLDSSINNILKDGVTNKLQKQQELISLFRFHSIIESKIAKTFSDKTDAVETFYEDISNKFGKYFEKIQSAYIYGMKNKKTQVVKKDDKKFFEACKDGILSTSLIRPKSVDESLKNIPILPFLYINFFCEDNKNNAKDSEKLTLNDYLENISYKTLLNIFYEVLTKTKNFYNAMEKDNKRYSNLLDNKKIHKEIMAKIKNVLNDFLDENANTINVKKLKECSQQGEKKLELKDLKTTLVLKMVEINNLLLELFKNF